VSAYYRADKKQMTPEVFSSFCQDGGSTSHVPREVPENVPPFIIGVHLKARKDTSGKGDFT
jgi:hypothetical protein